MYIFAVIFLSFFAFLEVFNRETVEKYRTVFVSLCFFFLVFHDGFRWETGCDWEPYSRYFENLFNYSIDRPGFELGYYFFMLPIRSITDNFSVYLVLHALLFYSCLFYAILKLSTHPFVSILLLYMVTVPIMGTNRQFLALAFYATGLVFLKDRRIFLYILTVILAFFFHRSAIVCLLIPLLYKKIKTVYLLAFLLIALIISFSGIINTLSPFLALLIADDETLRKFEVYTTLEYTNITFISTFISLARKLLWIFLLLFFENKIENKNQTYYTIFNIYFVASIFYIIFNDTMLQVFVSRGLMYYNIMEIFIVPYVLILFKDNYGKLLIMFILVGYVLISIKKGFSNYGENNDYFEPYKGLFINTDYERIDKD